MVIFKKKPEDLCQFFFFLFINHSTELTNVNLILCHTRTLEFAQLFIVVLWLEILRHDLEIGWQRFDDYPVPPTFSLFYFFINKF